MRIYLKKFSLHTTLHLIWSITLNVVDPVLFNDDQLVSPPPPCPQITQIVLHPHSQQCNKNGNSIAIQYCVLHPSPPIATWPFCITAGCRKYSHTCDAAHTSRLMFTQYCRQIKSLCMNPYGHANMSKTRPKDQLLPGSFYIRLTAENTHIMHYAHRWVLSTRLSPGFVAVVNLIEEHILEKRLKRKEAFDEIFCQS